jgi:hypothetical protein
MADVAGMKTGRRDVRIAARLTVEGTRPFLLQRAM